MKQKKKNDIAALLDYAGSHRGLTFLGLGLSAASMVCSMIPYLCIWLAARDLIEVAPNWTQAQSVARYGWLAFGAAFGGIVLYFGGLMCTHLAAFRTAANIRKRARRDYQTYKELMKDSVVRLYADDVRTDTALVRLTDQYALLALCVETPELLVFLKDRDRLLILPKRCLLFFLFFGHVFRTQASCISYNCYTGQSDAYAYQEGKSCSVE